MEYTKGMSHGGFCAFCRSPKTYFKRRRLGLANIFGALLSAAAINYIFTHGVDSRVLVIFIANLFVLEFALKIRWRMSLICKECGFDPVIYKRSPETACQMVKDKTELRRADPIKNLFFPLTIPKRREPKKDSIKAIINTQ